MNKILSFFKNLFADKKTYTAPRIAETPIETIEFPPTYVDVNLYHTIPAPTTDGMSGKQFANSVMSIDGSARDNTIYQQCLLGNIPDWMRNFKAITVEENGNKLIYFISPDVLCIGNNGDFLRVSLDAYNARRVVDLFGCMLPTSKISDQIWQSANLKMMPTGMGASFHMGSTATMVDHNYSVIEKQRAGRNFSIIAGHKKDIIFHSELLNSKFAKNICIYGFHLPSGQPIQDAQYKAHVATYQDYSHSIRLVSRKALLNGSVVDLMDVLNNKQYAYLISKDGAYNAADIYHK